MLESLLLIAVALIDLAFMAILFSINQKMEKPAIRKLPKISVIIAAKEGKIVEHTLKMLKKIKRPRLEIIVAANDSETVKIARKYTKKVVRDRGIGKGAALNIAVKKATCDILYFLDEDMVIEKDTIAKVCSGLNGHEVAVGYNISKNKDGLVARLSRLYLAMLTRIQFGIYKLIGTTFVGGRNFAIYKKTLKKAGFFRNVLTEDLELSFRLFNKNKKVKFVNAAAKDQTPEKFSWYAKQQQRWNVGAGQALMEWEKRLHHHDIILFLFVALMALVPLISLISLILVIIFGGYVFLSVFILCFLIGLSSAAKLGRDDIILFPITFATLMIVQSAMIFYSAVAKPKNWYRTPKV